MNQPKKLKKQKPDLKRRLDAVRAAPEPDIRFSVTIPADVYRALAATAGGDVGLWVAQMLVEAVEGGLLDEDGADGQGGAA